MKSSERKFLQKNIKREDGAAADSFYDQEVVIPSHQGFGLAGNGAGQKTIIGRIAGSGWEGLYYFDDFGKKEDLFMKQSVNLLFGKGKFRIG